ncbi:MAG: PIN domain-containing protein [Alphaproteobacteria bacterium]|nr:PIN domain-containing protein [Alphaproteobacteria bacterium]
MKPLVLDASVAAAWLMPSQATKASERLLLRIGELDLIAPHIFVWEVGNLLVRQSRRGLPLPDARQFLDDLCIGYVESYPPHAVLNLTDEAAATGLSLFDVAYLALAAELDAPLASRDGALIAAAAGLGLECLDLRYTEAQ